MDVQIFGEEDLLRVKNEMLRRQEDPEEFFTAENLQQIVSVWAEDDARRREKVLSKMEKLAALSSQEWDDLMMEVRKIGSMAYYTGEVDAISPFSPDKRFGIELEYAKDEEYTGEHEVQFPPRGRGGYANTPENWEEVRKGLRELEQLLKYAYKHMHIHIDRTGLENEGAFTRLSVAFQGILYLLGSRIRVIGTPVWYLLTLDDFFSDKGIYQKNKDINFSEKLNTIEFRFFQIPVYSESEKFNLDLLQSEIALAMQMVQAVIERPEDFSLLTIGLPGLLGMHRGLISQDYIAKFADKLFDDNLEGKLNFLRMLSVSEKTHVFVKEDKKEYLDKETEMTIDDGTVKKAYESRGLGYLYELHKKSGRLDEDIVETLKREANELKDQKSLERYEQLRRFLVILSFSKEDNERKFAREMLEVLGNTSLLDRINEFLEGIRDEWTREYFVRDVFPTVLRASTNRSDEVVMEMLGKILKLAKGIGNLGIRVDFDRDVIPDILKTLTNRSDEVVMQTLELAVWIGKIGTHVNFVRDVILDFLKALTNRGDAVVMQILKLAGGIRDKGAREYFVRDVFPAVLRASINRSDEVFMEMLGKILELLGGIGNVGINVYFFRDAILTLLNALTNRSDEVVMQILKLAGGIRDEGAREYFVRDVFPAVLSASTNRSDERVMEMLGKIFKLVEGIGDGMLRQDFVIHAVPAVLKASTNRSDEDLVGELQRWIEENDVPTTSSPLKQGGIDLNPGTLDLQTRGGGIEFNAPFANLPCIDSDGDGVCEAVDMEALENMDINGFTPVIFSITPVTNLPALLGLAGEDAVPAEEAESFRQEAYLINERQRG